jgi:hypothetical protein
MDRSRRGELQPNPHDFTSDFLEIWLEDYYVRSREDKGLARQMDEFCRRSFNATAREFTEALVLHRHRIAAPVIVGISGFGGDGMRSRRIR